MRSKRSIQTLEAPAPVCAVAFSAAGDQVYSAGLDNNITAWELRKGVAGMTLQGHADTVTGLRVSPGGEHLLSNSMDNTLRVWDMRPYAPANRCACWAVLCVAPYFWIVAATVF
jgi:Prp8 binding protein